MNSGLKRAHTSQVNAGPSKRARNLVEVVSDGDVLLKVGRGANFLDIRISGKVISLASAVFSRMLSSSFSEASTKVIELREDDPEVVLDFCNIIHHKTENLDHCNGKKLLKLAELADARFCAKTLRPWIATRLSSVLNIFEWDHERDSRGHRGSGISKERLLQLGIEQHISIAAVFQLDDLFWFTTRYFILQTCSSGNVHQRLPAFANSALGRRQHCLQEVLEKARKQRLHDFLDDVFKSVGKDFDSGALHGSSKEKRACSFSRYSAFMFYLAREGIKPGQAEEYRNSLSVAMDVIWSLSQETKPAFWCRILARGGCTIGLPNPCRYCQRDIAADLLQVVERHMEKAPGVCLFCFKACKKEFFHHACTHHMGLTRDAVDSESYSDGLE